MVKVLYWVLKGKRNLRVNLEPIIESEVRQKEKDKYCILTLAYGM